MMPTVVEKTVVAVPMRQPRDTKPTARRNYNTIAKFLRLVHDLEVPHARDARRWYRATLATELSEESRNSRVDYC